MRDILTASGTCVFLAAACYGLVAVPALSREIADRVPLAPACDINRQLHAEIAYTRSVFGESLPAYARILSDYEPVANGQGLAGMESLSASTRKMGYAESIIAGRLLKRAGLPEDLLATDPVGDIRRTVRDLQEEEARLEVRRDAMLFDHSLECLKQDLSVPPPDTPLRVALPSDVLTDGMVFCGETIPLDRDDVRRRIEHQVEYLLNDLRASTGIWLTRRDRYRDVVQTVLREEGVPDEFSLLPALESGYRRSAVSPAMAAGWWQFVRPTIQRSTTGKKDAEWTLHVGRWKDERGDLVLSTRAAARYLKWMKGRLGGDGRDGSWLTAAAAYNAGLDEVKFRTQAYATTSYWDMKLPLETEHYIPRWIALSIIDGNRAFYGIKVPPISPLSFDTIESVRLEKDLPLGFLAAMTESSVRFIRELNGAVGKKENAFKASKNSSENSHTIHVPQGWKDRVVKALKAHQYIKGE